MKQIRRLSLVVIASFILALNAFGCGPKDGPATASAASPAKHSKVAPAPDCSDIRVAVTEESVELNGKSTYALSVCAPTFVAIANTIGRAEPDTPPPIRLDKL